MASSETYSSRSIINIASDAFTVDTGTVTRSGGEITFSANSRCTFSKNYGNKGLSTKKLKVIYSINASNLTTRYNNNIFIQLKIQYYNRTYVNDEYVYTDGNWQTIEVIPYNNNENKGNYKNDIIDTNGNYIKQIKIIIGFNGSSGSIILEKLNIYNTVDINEEEITQDIEYEVTHNNNIKDYFNGLISEAMQDGCFLRLLYSESELINMKEGELCRCNWIQ